MVTYASFRTKIECMIRERVLPRLAHGAPNVVAFNEDIGLMTLGTGSRGAEARAIVEDPASVCPGEGFPARRSSTLARCSRPPTRGRSAPTSQRFPEPARASARVFTGGHGHLRARLDAGVLGHGASATASTSSARTTSRRSASRSTRPRSTRSATPTCRGPSRCSWPPGPKVYNEAFMWAPARRAQRGAARRCATWCSRTRRCRSPTSRTSLAGRERPQHRPRRGREPAAVPAARHARADRLRHEPAGVHLRRPARRRGPLLRHEQVLHALPRQARHEPRDAGRGEPGPLGHRRRRSGSRSTGCAPPGARSPIPTVDFDYNVTPHLVGQLGDLVFDGQTAITQRGLRGREALQLRGQLALPARARRRTTPPRSSPTRARKREFLALAPWVTPDAPRADAARDAGEAGPGLRRPARERLPGDGDRGRPAVPARLLAAQLHLVARRRPATGRHRQAG